MDFCAVVRPDVMHDLSIFPYPFEDNSFDLIEADHVIEHLGSPFRVIKELHRIGRNNAKVSIKTPHFSRAFTHPEHKSGFDVSLPLYYSPSFTGGYQGVEFSLTRMRLRWFGQPYLKKKTLSPPAYWVGRALGVIIDVFANLSPYACSRIWCFWVGGFDELEFEFCIRK